MYGLLRKHLIISRSSAFFLFVFHNQLQPTEFIFQLPFLLLLFAKYSSESSNSINFWLIRIKTFHSYKNRNSDLPLCQDLLVKLSCTFQSDSFSSVLNTLRHFPVMSFYTWANACHCVINQRQVPLDSLEVAFALINKYEAIKNTLAPTNIQVPSRFLGDFLRLAKQETSGCVSRTCNVRVSHKLHFRLEKMSTNEDKNSGMSTNEVKHFRARFPIKKNAGMIVLFYNWRPLTSTSSVHKQKYSQPLLAHKDSLKSDASGSLATFYGISTCSRKKRSSVRSAWPPDARVIRTKAPFTLSVPNRYIYRYSIILYAPQTGCSTRGCYGKAHQFESPSARAYRTYPLIYPAARTLTLSLPFSFFSLSYAKLLHVLYEVFTFFFNSFFPLWSRCFPDYIWAYMNEIIVITITKNSQWRRDGAFYARDSRAVKYPSCTVCLCVRIKSSMQKPLQCGAWIFKIYSKRLGHTKKIR